MATTKRKTRKKVDAPQQESMVNNAPRTFTDADFPVGSVAHQGDLILVRLEGLPEKAIPRKDRQLAEGNTQGSRHFVTVGKVFDCDAAAVVSQIGCLCRGVRLDAKYVGPVFKTVKGKADLEHPEHGHHLYRGDMVVATVYQRNLDSEEREARVQD